MLYRFADCELDTDAHELRRGGVPQHVEPQVLAVLVHLAAHPDRVVGRDELLDEVWGHRFVTEATLSSRIKAARRATGDSGSRQEVIRTLRGRGFRLVAPVESVHPEPARAADGDGGARTRLVGRDGELRILRSSLTAALAGVRQVAFVSGEAGIGKTTVLDALLAEAEATPGMRVARGACIEHRGAGEPFLPVLDALGRLGGRRDGADVAACLARDAPTWLRELPSLHPETAPEPPAGATAARMVRELLNALDALCDRSALVLALEDLHWSDQSTLEAIGALARREGAARLMVVATYRPGPEDGARRAMALAAELVGHERAVGVRLGPLGDALADLATVHLGGAADPAVVDVLRKRSGGNPLLARALLDGWAAQGALVEDGGRWRAGCAGALDGVLPGTLAALLDAQVERLPEEDRALLEAASVVGRRFSAAAVAAACGIPIAPLEGRCLGLARAGRLLELDGPHAWPDGTVADGFAFVHDAVRQVLSERLTTGRRAELHRRVGRRLQEAWRGREAEIAAELAHHAIAAGDSRAAIDHLLRAAEVATGRGAPREAATLLRRALRCLEGAPPSEDARPRELRVQSALAASLATSRGWGDSDAEAAYRRALTLARSHGDGEALARVLYGMATLYEYRGEYARSQALMEERLALSAATSNDRRVESHELLACSLFHQGSYASALEHARRGIAARGRTLAAAGLGEDPEASCHGWAALSLWFLEDPDAALAEAGLAVAAAPAPHHGCAGVLVQAARLHQHRGDADGTRELAAAARTEASRGGYAYLQAAAAILHGWARAAAGEPAGADEAVRGLRDHERTGAAMDRPYYAALAAEALAWHGRVPEALGVADAGLSLIGPDRPFFYGEALQQLRQRLTASTI